MGIRWIGQSFSLFGKNPSIWIVMLLVFVGINFGLTMIPYLELLPTILAPAFTVGFYMGCIELQRGGDLQIDHLFNGFKKQGRSLVRLGLLFFVWNIVIYLLTMMFVQQMMTQEHADLLAQAQTQEQLTAIFTQNPELLNVIINGIFVALILSVPLVMASWFSPALVAFQNVPPLKAMTLSLKACNKNFIPFLIYGLLMVPLLVLSFVPLLGLGLLVMLPVIVIGQYVCYQSVFPNTDSTEDEKQGIITL